MAKRELPAGWRVISNDGFVTPVNSLDGRAKAFADSVEGEFKKLFGSYTKSDSQVVIMENVPAEDAFTRARTMLFDRGYRTVVRWVNRQEAVHVASLEVYPPAAAAAGVA